MTHDEIQGAFGGFQDEIEAHEYRACFVKGLQVWVALAVAVPLIVWASHVGVAGLTG